MKTKKARLITNAVTYGVLIVLFIILTMMVLCITTLSAQSIIGKWYADEVAEAMELNELGDVVLNIKERTISTDFYINIEDDGAKIKMLYSIPGTYTQSGKKVTAKFNADKTDVKVVDFKTNDPELLAEMKTEKGKKELYEVISSLIESEMGDLVKGLAEISEIFNKFTVNCFIKTNPHNVVRIYHCLIYIREIDKAPDKVFHFGILRRKIWYFIGSRNSNR